MRDYAKKQQQVSRTIGANPKAANQTSILKILQCYKKPIIQPIRLKDENKLIQKLFRQNTLANVIQKKGHKPRAGDIVRYPAASPTEGEQYNVLESLDGGLLRLQRQRDNNTINVDWKTDNIWIVYADDPKDRDMRHGEVAWNALTEVQKRGIYNEAKTNALNKIKVSVIAGMINQTNKDRLNTNLTLAFFNKIKKGEWQVIWEEGNGRKWQFTIDMDKPIDTSWQEPHVGWEVKLLSRGKNHADIPYPDFSKEQGHIWLNDVPEARAH